MISEVFFTIVPGLGPVVHEAQQQVPLRSGSDIKEPNAEQNGNKPQVRVQICT